jgi:arylsulfatase A-like enzyme
MRRTVAVALRLVMPVVVMLAPGGAPLQAASRNVVLLIADDFGIDAAGFYPTSVRRPTTPPPPPTPNLAALAQRGVLFTRAWADPWCSPTRATILTGRYGFRTGIGRANTSNLPPLSVDEFSLPEAFAARSDLGHVVASFGKWHLSSGEDDPNQHGWPYYAGSHPDLGKLPSYFSWPKTVNGITTTSTTYATTDTVDEALGVIARAKSENMPYVLWVAFNAPHDPHHKPPNELHSRDALPEPFDPALRRAYFEAMVEAMDTEIGRLLKAVDLARTTVIFLGDNGTSPEVTAKPYQSLKAKGTTYQGGVHVPLLVAGAGVVSPGRTASALVNTVDLFPTILRLAGIDPSAVVPDGTKTDGVSLMPYIGNRAHPNPRRWAYAEGSTRATGTAGSARSATAATS